MEIKRGQVWRNKKSGNLVQVVPEPCVLVFTSPKGELVAEYSLVVFEQLYEPVATEDAQMIKPKHPSSIRNKGLEVNEAKEMVIKADRLEIDGVDMSKTWVDARVKGMAGAELHQENAPKPDMVNQPPHYKDASGIECKEITCHRKMPFSLGNAIKYLYRAGSKGDLLEDLKKAEWYLRVAYLNNERVPKAVEVRLLEVAAHRKTAAGRALNAISLHKVAAAYQVVKQEVEKMESNNEG